MLKKFILLTLTFALFLGQAMASTQDGLKLAFEEFMYSMEVDGASLNPNTEASAYHALEQRLNGLRAQGVSNQEIMTFALSKVPDQNLALELRTISEQLEFGNVDAATAQKLIQKALQSSYARGASWTGDVTIVLGMAAAVLFLTAGLPILILTLEGDQCWKDSYSAAHPQECNP